MTDEKLYQTIATELETGSRDAALWTRALAEADGDSERTKALYIRLRLHALRKTATKLIATRAQPVRSELEELRQELSEGLYTTRISNFYDVLGVTPTASDSDIGSAIAEGEARVASGAATASPEFRYAKETLGNPQGRASYDRRLYEKVQNALPQTDPAQRVTQYVQAEGVFLPWWASKKVAAMIGLVAFLAIGYLGLDYSQERGIQETQKASIEVQHDAVRAAAANEGGRVANERLAIQGRISVTDKAIDRSAELQNRAIRIQEQEEERRRTELEYRANAGGQLLELQRERQRHEIAMQQERSRVLEQQAIELKANRERAYWACMKNELDRTDSTTASARCAAYRWR